MVLHNGNVLTVNALPEAIFVMVIVIMDTMLAMDLIVVMVQTKNRNVVIKTINIILKTFVSNVMKIIVGLNFVILHNLNVITVNALTQTIYVMAMLNMDKTLAMDLIVKMGLMKNWNIAVKKAIVMNITIKNSVIIMVNLKCVVIHNGNVITVHVLASIIYVMAMLIMDKTLVLDQIVMMGLMKN